MNKTTTTTITVKSSTETFISPEEIMEVLGVSRTTAYKFIAQLNNELESRNFIVVNGKVSRKYFNERFYGKVW